MSIQRSEVVAIVMQKLKELAASMLAHPAIDEINDQTRLFGRQGLLDSIGLVSLIVDVEQTLAEKTGLALTLADEHAMSQARSPFRTVASLSDYALERINQHVQRK
jgi:acyl carrier protein